MVSHGLPACRAVGMAMQAREAGELCSPFVKPGLTLGARPGTMPGSMAGTMPGTWLGTMPGSMPGTGTCLMKRGSSEDSLVPHARYSPQASRHAEAATGPGKAKGEVKVAKKSKKAAPSKRDVPRAKKPEQGAAAAAATTAEAVAEFRRAGRLGFRVQRVEVPLDLDPGKNDVAVSEALVEAVAAKLACQAEFLPPSAICIVRKSFDSRRTPKFVYTVDVDAAKLKAAMSASGTSPKKAKAVLQKLRADAVDLDAPPVSPITLSGRVSSMMTSDQSHGRASSRSFPLEGGADVDADVDLPRTAAEASSQAGAAVANEALAGIGMAFSPSGPAQQLPRQQCRQVAEEESDAAVQTGAAFSEGQLAATRGRETASETWGRGGGEGRWEGRVRERGEGRQGGARRNVVVGSGPAGLFAALVLAEKGESVVLIERGQGVEERGRDIGALAVRRILDPNSNFCYGEGGAGTWSDGKLTTRIGKNSEEVQAVLRTLVAFGAPERILVDGKPHLGTDRLVRILRRFREHLISMGVDIRFGTILTDLVVRDRKVVGVKTRPAPRLLPARRQSSAAAPGDANEDADFSGQGADIGAESADNIIHADRVVLGVGHSARSVFEILRRHQVAMTAKDFAVGFRVEHPQALINQIQYGRWADPFSLPSLIAKGRGKVPVADYSLATAVSSTWRDQEPRWTRDGTAAAADVTSAAGRAGSGDEQPMRGEQHQLLQQQQRGCYSFCMCPGGQVVSTSTSEWELCVNGMSFSQRSSPFANAALVTTVTARDFAPFEEDHGALAGVAFQRAIERQAAMAGGGNLVAPVQRVTDFLDGKLRGGPLPPSSYRLGVREAHLDRLFPPDLTAALQMALVDFDRQLPGFISDEGVLHGVESRTSSPVRIERDKTTHESISLKGLFPIGEGAGYAGGIVSAAVDGMRAAVAMAEAAASSQR